MSLVKIKNTKGEWEDITSVAGLKGEKGDTGHTPQRGTDYWTDADKEEIRAYVDEAILGGAW